MWKALGRSVKQGEHGVRVVTFITCNGKQRDPASGEERETSLSPSAHHNGLSYLAD